MASEKTAYTLFLNPGLEKEGRYSAYDRIWRRNNTRPIDDVMYGNKGINYKGKFGFI